MRNPSQIFADALRSDDPDQALGCIRTYGWDKTRAAFWLALQPQIDDRWTDEINEMSEDQIHQTRVAGVPPLLTALALGDFNWADRKNFVRSLVEQLTVEDFENFFPVHHAAYHGAGDAFPLLTNQYTRLTGRDFDWNARDSEGHPPLVLALQQQHLSATVAIVLAGGSPEALMHDPKDPHKKPIGALAYVLKGAGQGLAAVKKIWDVASDKAALLNTVGGQVKGKGKKRAL